LNWIPNFVLKILGRKVATKLNLQEDSPMDTTKPWYQSRTIWANIITFLIGVYGLVGANLSGTFHFVLPAIPAWLITILSAIGVYGRANATTEIQ
jgi:hypothetical protein